MASSHPLNAPPRSRPADSTRCEARAELAAIAAIADDIGRRNGTRLNPTPTPLFAGRRELAGISSTAAPELAPRDFLDAKVTFGNCNRTLDLEPHPSLMAGPPLTAQTGGGLRAAPLEDRTYTLMTPHARK